MAYFHLVSLWYIYKNWFSLFTSIVSTTMNLLYMLVSSTATDLSIIFLLIIDTASSTVFAACCIFITKLRQLNQILQRKRPKVVHLSSFMRSHTRTLTDIIHGDHFYGILVFYYILTIVPMSTFILCDLFAKKFNVLTGLFNACLTCFVCLGLVVFHVTASYFSKLLHASVPALFHLVPRLNRVSLQTKLKLSLYIQKMSVSNAKRYGISYGDFSLMSVETFFKVM